MPSRKFTLKAPRHGPRAGGAGHRGPLASIVICNHNYERFLAEAIDSALRQTYAAVEIIVIDDGSTDNSRMLIERYGRLVRAVFKRNGGQPSAINAGFRESCGEIVCLLDADDMFAPDKVARAIEIFARNPESGWIFHELDYVDEHGRDIPLHALDDQAHARAVLRRRRRYGAFSHIDLRERFAAGERLPYACPAFSALVFRRHVLDAILPMPEDIARAGDEFPKFAALALFPGIHLGDRLARQRIHDANASTFRDTSVESATRFLKTAYHLRYRYRHIGPSTDKWFASSFGRLLGAVGPRATLANVETQRYLKDYFGPFTWMRQGPRIAYHAARERLSGGASAGAAAGRHDRR
jgi:glycosyltransferase involved in cell wall biosynthesis